MIDHITKEAVQFAPHFKRSEHPKPPVASNDTQSVEDTVDISGTPSEDGVVGDYSPMRFNRFKVSNPAEARMDSNDDGTVQKVEIKRAMMIKDKVDANDDGTIQKAEIGHAAEKPKLHPAVLKNRVVDNPIEKELDANNDGILDRHEVKLAKENNPDLLDELLSHNKEKPAESAEAAV